MSREKLMELAAGLREAADWIEANPDLPVSVGHSNLISLRCETVEQMTVAAKALRTFDKNKYLPEYYFSIERMFRGARLVISGDHDKVCKKVTKLVEKTVWECPETLLAPEEELLAAGEPDSR